MALSAEVLGPLIKEKRVAALGDALATDAAGQAALDADCQAIAEAVIEHLLSAAVITTASACTAGGAVGTAVLT